MTQIDPTARIHKATIIGKGETIGPLKDDSNFQGLTYEEILDELPQRAPFLMIDKVLEIDIPGNRIVAQKNVTFNEPHFPHHHVMQIEALAQLGAIFWRYSLFVKREDVTGLIVLTGLKNVKFRRIVRPGDILRLEATSKCLNKRGIRFMGRATVDGEIACEAEISGVIVHE